MPAPSAPAGMRWPGKPFSNRTQPTACSWRNCSRGEEAEGMADLRCDFDQPEARCSFDRGEQEAWRADTSRNCTSHGSSPFPHLANRPLAADTFEDSIA